MILHRLGALIGLAIAAVTLSGCFVTSVNRMDGDGVDADPALVGAWRGLDEDGKIEKGVFLHVVAHKAGEGLRLALIDTDSIMLFEGTTVTAGPHHYLNAMLQEQPGMKPEDRAILGTHIVRYEVKGKTLSMWLLDPSEIAQAVETGKLKGKVEGSSLTKSVTLSATSEELNAFFAKPDAAKYFQDKPAKLVRFEN